MLIDTHCHLNILDVQALGGALEDVLNLAKESNIRAMVCVGLSLDHAHEVLDLADQYPQVYATVGLHPNELCENEPAVADFIEKAKHPKVVAIGECGLDYFRNDVPKNLQKQRFMTQIEAAKSLNLPIVVHMRDTACDVLDIIEETGIRKGILHCFTGTLEEAMRGISLGFYISFSGIVTFKNAADLQEVAKQIPLDALLVETDAPYLSPHPYRGKPNHPAQVRWVAEKIAELKGLSFDEVSRITTENACKVFPELRALCHGKG